MTIGPIFVWAPKLQRSIRGLKSRYARLPHVDHIDVESETIGSLSNPGFTHESKWLGTWSESIR